MILFKNKFFAAVIILALLFNVLVIMIYAFSVSLADGKDQVTAYASKVNANVNISISGVLSIIPDDRIINFTGCNTNATIFSNVSGGNIYSDCEGFVADSIIIRNDGTYNANVSVEFSDWGQAHNGTFLTSLSNSSWLAYTIKNDSQIVEYGGGCLQGMQQEWFNVTNINKTRVCDLLQADIADNSFSMDFAIHIPADVQSGANTFTVSFWAQLP